MLRKMIMDISTIYYQSLNLFPYWRDSSLKEWDTHYADLMISVPHISSIDEFYQRLMRFVSLLDDGHSMVYLPKQMKDKNRYLPFKLEIIEEELVIVDAVPEYRNDLFLPIKKINGMTTERFLASLRAHYWQSNVSLSLIHFQDNPSFLIAKDLVTIEFAPNASKEYPLLKKPIDWADAQIEASLIAGKIFFNNRHLVMTKVHNQIIVNIKDFMDPHLVTAFYQHLPILQDSTEIIFDIRGNLGGNSGFANEIAQAFFSNRIQTEKVYYQHFDAERYANATQELFSHHEDQLHKQPQFAYLNHQWLIEKDEFDYYENRQGLLKDKKVKLLIDARTYSSAENFAMIFDQRKRGLIIGETSAGSTGQPALIKLQTGGVFMVTAKKVLYPDGRPHHNIGITPHIHLKKKLADKTSDQVLKKALTLTIDAENKTTSED